MKQNKISVAVSVLFILVVAAAVVFLGAGSSPSLKENVVDIWQSGGVKITRTGEGAGEGARIGSRVRVNYTGRLTDGAVFDSSVLPEFGHPVPFVFTIGSGEVIKGWDVGIEGMRVGEKRTLEIAPEYAYGERGAGSAIPPNSTIVFDVELVEIIK